MSFFMRQNELIANGTISGPGVHSLHMNTLGIINGCVDILEQVRAYATFPVNNTYGLKIFNDTEYYHSMYELTRPDGIIDQINECRRLERELDRNNYGDVDYVNEYCRNATAVDEATSAGLYISESKAGWYDITHPAQDSFPPEYFIGFLNQHWVQKALGVPVNHSVISDAVYQGFTATGDGVKGGLLDDLAYILDHGVQVAMMYGDRDYACNWVQGEQSSLKIPWSSQESFEAAGYTPLVMSPVHSGGLTRQYGNLSFTRVYQAGHMVPSYQPKASYEIFMRALLGKDIATGTVDLQEVAAKGKQYATEGPGDTWWMKNDVLPAPLQECYYLDIGRCTDEEKEWVFDGTAVVKDFIVVGRNEGALPAARGDYDEQILLANE